MTEKKEAEKEIKRIDAYEETLIKERTVIGGKGRDLDQVPHHKKTSDKIIAMYEAAFLKSLKRYLMNPKDTKEALKKSVYANLAIENISQYKKLTMRELEKNAKKHLVKREMVALVEGAVFGLGGVTSSAVEIPLFLKQVFQHVEQIAMTFGVDPFHYVERVYIVKLIALALSQDQTFKRETVADLKHLETLIHKRNVSHLHQVEAYHFDKVAKLCSKSISRALAVGKSAQSLPLIGSGAGALSNYAMMSKISKVALNFYKRRFLERRWHHRQQDRLI